MEDKDLKNLFDNFRPPLKPETSFMDELQQKLDTVEFVRRQNARLKANCRRAVVLAAVAGIAVGFLCSLLLPHLQQFLANWLQPIPHSAIYDLATKNFNIISWLIIAAATAATALNTYEFSLSKSPVRKDS